MEPLVSSTATALYSDAAIITDLGRLPQSDQEGNDIAMTNTVLLKIPKLLKRFSRCCFRPDEVAANEKVLMTLFISFFLFTVSQFVVAFAANSLSLGDTSAQIVDCMDYAFNFIAERRKHRFDQRYQDPACPNLSPERALQLRQRAKRKALLFWEVAPPALSLICLAGVNTFVLQDSIRTLVQDFTTKPKSQQGDVNLTMVLTLQLVNLVIDTLNFTCFARIHHFRGFGTVHQPHDVAATDTTTTANTSSTDFGTSVGKTELEKAMEGGRLQGILQKPSCNKRDCCDVEKFVVKNEKVANSAVSSMKSSSAVATSMNDCGCADNEDQANLNLCSAYTHVLADSMRTVSILSAVILAMVIEPLTAEAADSAAAVVVSLIIFMSLVPLLQGIVVAFSELRQLRAEEQAERNQQIS